MSPVPGAGADGITTRPATAADWPAIVRLGTRTLGWLGDDADLAFLRWKHEENPFGPSPMWVACAGERVVGFRTFLRWELVDRTRAGGGRTVRAVRAVDTATDPDFQGQGIFTRLTLAALDALAAERVDMVFNTPNANSLPGYLKMGWLVVGRLPVSVMPTRPGSLTTLLRARTPASRSAVLVRAGEAPREAFADRAGLAAVLATDPGPRGLASRRTPEFLAWRYGHEPLHYRVVLAGASVAEGIAVFHLRRRGAALEAVLCDVVVPEPHRPSGQRVAHGLAREIARITGADYVLRIDHRPATAEPFVRVPRTGPLLTFRRLDGYVPPRLGRWRLTLGDIELF